MTCERERPCDVLILCGGFGKRLGDLTQKVPKPLLEIGGEPFLLHRLKHLHREGFERFLLAVHYLAGRFADFVEQYRRQFPGLEMIVEEKPLGTGGALRKGVARVASPDFVALNGDTFLTQPMFPVLQYHRQNGNRFTMVAVKAENVDGDLKNRGGLSMGDGETLLDFQGHCCAEEKWVNGGMYVARRETVLSWPQGAFSLEKELISLLRPDGAGVFRSAARLLDIGTHDCLKRARTFYETYSIPSG